MKALITGTSRGIGKAIAELFLSKGHEVIGFDIEPSSITHAHYFHYQLDIAKSDLPDIEGVEVLIDNAGTQDEDRAIEVNLLGNIKIAERYGIQPSIKSVLFIASSSASTGAEFPLYSASKGGIVAYMKNLAQRIAKYGATCNSLSPGGVDTALNKHILDDPKLHKAVLDETLLGKWASPEEIAQWAYFLTCINRSMTAQDVLVDNGEAAKFNFIW